MKYPILYAKDATDFFSLGLGVLTNTLEAKVTEERNGSFFLEAKVLTDTEMYKKIELDSLIKADAGASLKDQRFRVKRVIENHDGTADVYAEHISYLTQELSLRPNVTVRGPADVAIKAWAANIIDKHPFIVDSDIRTDSSTTWEIGDVDNAREALGGVQGSMLDVWGGEYLFDNYHISLKEKRGKTANALIAYGRNITDFEQEKNIMSTYTSLFPYARYTDDDQNEHLVTLPEYLVDSEYVNNYPNRKALPVDFSSEFEDKNIPTPAKLKALAERYIKDNEVGIPKVSIQVSFLDLSKTLDYKEMATLEELNLCDDVRVEYPKLGISTVSKVVKVVWDVLADRYDTIEIGAKRTTLGTTIKEQNDAIKEIEKNTNDALVSSDGKNMIFYGLYGEDGLGEPTATKVGDLWYKPNGDYTIMYVWNGTVWEQVLNTEDEAIIKDELEQMGKDVQDAKDKADEVATGLNVIKIDVDKAIEDSQKAKDDAIKALEENESTKLEAQKAKEQSDQAIKDASTSMLNAKEALDKATENETSIGGLQVDVDKTKNELKTKANQSDLNTLKGTVTNQQTQITQNATDIKTKAEKTYVDTINNKVDKQQTQINQNSESIKLKAEKQEVTNLKNELDGLEFGGTNALIGSDKIIVGGLDFEDGSRNEYQALNVGKTFQNNFDFGDEVTISFDIETNTGVNRLLIYNNNNKGRYKIQQRTIDSIEKGKSRQYITTKLEERKGWDKVDDWIEFFSIYGTSDWYKITKIKIEKGNKPTAWSPAPEDMASAEQVKDISASLEVQAGKIEMKADQTVVDNLKNTVNKQGTAITQNSEAIKLKAEKSQVDSLTGKVDKQQTEITQNAEQIKLKANQSVVNDIDNKVTNQQAQINLNSENIKLKAEKSEVTNLKNELDGLEIGGVNLLSNNKSKWQSGYYRPNGDLASSSQDIAHTEKIPINHSDYVLQLWGKADEYSSGNISVVCFKDDNALKRVVSSRFNAPHTILKFEIVEGTTHIGVSFPSWLKNVETLKFKLEYGNKPTAWSPAPEDLASQSDVTKLEASINVEAGKITNLTSSVNKNTTEIGKLTIESNKISSQVTSVEKDVIKHTSQITQLSDDILLRVQKGDVINQINVSTEGVLIQGKKIHITGQTKIDNAVIKNAMIADGSITNAKIQNATITSAKIAQLDAGKITTGELKSILITGANSYWDLSTGLFKMYNPTDNKQQITIQNGAFVSTDGKGRTITIKDDYLNANSGNNNIYLDPKMILFRGEGYTRHLELQGQGLTISSFEQKTGQNEYLNAGLEIESLGTQSYIDFRTGGRTNDFDTRIKSVEGATANGQGTLQIEAKRFETITNEVRFREAQSIDFNGALANNLPKNLISTAIKRSMSVLAIEKSDTGDNHYFNFRMRDLNHGIRDWGVSTWASDERLKTNIKPTEISGLGLVDKLNVVQFDWKAGGTHESMGLIAQEVEKIYPKAVFENFSEIKQLKPEAFVPVLIKAIQELKSDNERMTRQIIELQLNGKGV